MQVSKKFSILGRLSFIFTPPKMLFLLPKFFKMNAQAIQARIDNRGNTKHPDFFEFMLPKDAPEPTTKKQKVHLDQVALQLFIAGWDPIQLTLYGCFYFLLKDPRALAMLVAEVRSSFQKYEDITPDGLVGLKYLNACIHETLRCHTTNANGFPRRSPGATVDGHYVPKGIVCEISYFRICRNPRYFYDPLQFRPERWLPSDHPNFDTKFANDDLKSFFPFGLGPRACTGKEIAWIQTRLFIAKVLWAFDLELQRGQNTKFDEDFTAHVMWYKPELLVKFRPR
jgi:cytochrome P450